MSKDTVTLRKRSAGHMKDVGDLLTSRKMWVTCLHRVEQYNVAPGRKHCRHQVVVTVHKQHWSPLGHHHLSEAIQRNEMIDAPAGSLLGTSTRCWVRSYPHSSLPQQHKADTTLNAG